MEKENKKIKITEEELTAELLENAKKVLAEKDEVHHLALTLGKILTENVELTDAEYKILKQNVSKACDENGKPVCLREMRRRISENYYGTTISFLVTMLGLIGDMYELQQEDHEMLVEIFEKLKKKED